jgi:hypothetical protein
MTAHFTCENCGGTFEKGWSDEEARAEAIGTFGAMPAEPAQVCDECYDMIMEWARRTNQPEIIR